ncbi:hypothetical protein C8Q77DRAFT_1061500 [Trametes polyzona]|nr:hypothetical protein C8Q77DRAFT_1061500 [Trametes polyzona]
MIQEIFGRVLSGAAYQAPWSDRSWKTRFSPPTTLATISSVCRRWRFCAINLPALWQDVLVYQHTMWLSISMARSAKMPLNLAFVTPKAFAASENLLSRERHRIRTLVVCPMQNDDALVGIDKLLSRTMPVLERIHINGSSYRGFRSFGHSSDTEHPSLHSISLIDVTLDWHSPFLRQLRSIVLTNTRNAFRGPSFTEFLLCLEACQNLEELELINAFPVGHHTRQPWENGGESPPDITLPNMRRLALAFPPPPSEATDLRMFLSHVGLPPSAELQIRAEVYMGRNGLPGMRTFLKYIPSNTRHLPMLRTAKRLIISPGAFTWEVESEGHIHRSWVSLVSSDRDHIPIQSSTHVRDILELFFKAPLECVVVQGVDGSIAAWQEFLGRFAALTELVVECSMPTLGGTTDVPPVLKALGKPNVALPKLRVLRVRQVRWDPELLKTITCSLRRRARRGLLRVSELELTVYGRPLGDPLYVTSFEDELASMSCWVDGPVTYLNMGRIYL